MEPGELFVARFAVEGRAGSGGMAEVYRARDQQTGQTVALKVLFNTEERAEERFVREAKLLAELRHPAFVKYVAHGTAPSGQRYIAMEWLDGETLEARLQRAGLEPEQSLALVTHVAEALAVAHARGIVHRDIKPSNLFLLGGDPERVKVLDLGIARVEAQPRSTRTGIMMGTPGYMAPEQARGERVVDARADVFSLGCVLFECIAGSPVFVAQNVMGLLAKILLEDAPRLSELRSEVPAALDDLTARMLAKEPSERPRDAAAVVEELALAGSMQGDAPAPVAPRAPALTVSEQRLLSVVLASANDGDPLISSPVDATIDPREAIGPVDALKAAAATYGGRLEQLADGSLVMTLSGSGAATDLAAQTARAALAMKAIVPDVPMALATGRGMVAGKWPVGEVIDRAVKVIQMRRRADRRDGGKRCRTVGLDEVTAGLLDVHFHVGDDDGILDLRGERDLAAGARTLLGKATPFVGRERDLANLEATYDECVADSVARAVLVTAPAGAGKSRLQHELLRRIDERDDGTAVWIGRGDPMRAGSPFGLLSSALKQTIGILDGEPLVVRQEKLRARVALGVAAAEVARVTAFLGELVGAPFTDEQSSQLAAARHDAMLMGDQMRRAFEDWLGAECGKHAVLLVLCDLHWGDLPTVKFIDAALRVQRDRPFMVLAFARPEVHDLFANLWAERELTEIRLANLSKKASERLVRHVLGDAVSAELVTQVVESAAGNALYLEELIRAVAAGKGGALPPTVLAMAQARMESLPAEDRRVLRAAAVFGQVFWRGGIRALLGAGDLVAGLPDSLAELVDRELVTRRAEGKFPGEEEYTFRNALLREAAYGMLTDADRILGHRLAAEWLEHAGESAPAVLADHHDRGGQPSRAVEGCRRAAEQALNGNDLDAALSWAERGIACGATGETLGAIRFVQAEAYGWKGDHAEAERAGLEALEVLSRGGDLWLSAAGEVATAGGKLGKEHQLVALGGELRDLTTPGEVGRCYVVAAARAAGQLYDLGWFELADGLLERIQAVGRRLADDAGIAAWILRVRAFKALFSGDPGTFLELTREAATCFERMGNLRNACLQRANFGFASVEIGAFAEAERALVDALTAAERMGMGHVGAVARQNLGIALARLGRLDEARATETDSVNAFFAQGDRRMEGASRIYLATIHALYGDLAAAEEEARLAVEVLEVAPPSRARALARLADILLTKGQADEALASASEAMGLLESLGQVEEGEALIRLTYADSLLAAGDRDAARTAVETAKARLLARAEKIGNPTWRSCFLEKVDENARTLALAARLG